MSATDTGGPSPVDAPPAPVPPWDDPFAQIASWICTSNPFYVLSAGLFLFGLRMSFGPQVRDLEAGALLSGLAGYTLLLAGTALVLVRFGNVWDDVRTVLLLVVLMFLATSVTFDELHVERPLVGIACDVIGFAFAVAVTETVLRAIRLTLPGWFRGPFYLILGLFFLFPAALTPFVKQPSSETLQWGLFAFPTVAGLAFLTLIPAVRRGADYVDHNGSPWRWPLYPWVVFGLLALAAPARGWLLCYSMHWVGLAHGGSTIFGLYFLAPFVLCLGLLLLEAGIAANKKLVTTIAMLTPFLAIGLSMAPGGFDPVARGFLRVYRDGIGGDPFFIAVVGAAAFFAYAAVRRVEGSVGALCGILAVLSFVGPDSFSNGRGDGLQSWPIAALTILQLVAAVRHGHVRHWIFAALGTFVFVSAVLSNVLRGEFVFGLALHAGIVVLAAGGAISGGVTGRYLRHATAWLLGFAVFLSLFVELAPRDDDLTRIGRVYALTAATFLVCYGALLRDFAMLRYGALYAVVWALRSVAWIYLWLRGLLPGLDWIVVSLAVFAAAFLVSVAKSGKWPRIRYAGDHPDSPPKNAC